MILPDPRSGKVTDLVLGPDPSAVTSWKADADNGDEDVTIEVWRRDIDYRHHVDTVPDDGDSPRELRQGNVSDDRGSGPCWPRRTYR